MLPGDKRTTSYHHSDFTDMYIAQYNVNKWFISSSSAERGGFQVSCGVVLLKVSTASLRSKDWICQNELSFMWSGHWYIQWHYSYIPAGGSHSSPSELSTVSQNANVFTTKHTKNHLKSAVFPPHVINNVNLKTRLCTVLQKAHYKLSTKIINDDFSGMHGSNPNVHYQTRPKTRVWLHTHNHEHNTKQRTSQWVMWLYVVDWSLYTFGKRVCACVSSCIRVCVSGSPEYNVCVLFVCFVLCRLTRVLC